MSEPVKPVSVKVTVNGRISLTQQIMDALGVGEGDHVLLFADKCQGRVCIERLKAPEGENRGA